MGSGSGCRVCLGVLFPCFILTGLVFIGAGVALYFTSPDVISSQIDQVCVSCTYVDLGHVLSVVGRQGQGVVGKNPLRCLHCTVGADTFILPWCPVLLSSLVGQGGPDRLIGACAKTSSQIN